MHARGVEQLLEQTRGAAAWTRRAQVPSIGGVRRCASAGPGGGEHVPRAHSKVAQADVVVGSATVVIAALAAVPAAGGSSRGSERDVRAAIQQVAEARIAHAAQGVGGSGPSGGAPAGGDRTRLVGSLGIAGGLNGDVYAYRGFAYVGTWSGPCPGTGVKVIDVRDPSRPRLVTTVGGYPNSSAEDMLVLTVSTAAFTGDLLAIGL